MFTREHPFKLHLRISQHTEIRAGFPEPETLMASWNAQLCCLWDGQVSVSTVNVGSPLVLNQISLLFIMFEAVAAFSAGILPEIESGTFWMQALGSIIDSKGSSPWKLAIVTWTFIFTPSPSIKWESPAPTRLWIKQCMHHGGKRPRSYWGLHVLNWRHYLGANKQVASWRTAFSKTNQPLYCALSGRYYPMFHQLWVMVVATRRKTFLIGAPPKPKHWFSLPKVACLSPSLVAFRSQVKT